MSTIYNLADIWNNGSTLFTGIRLDVNNAASDANSMFIDLLSSNTSAFKVRNDGWMQFSNGFHSNSNTAYMSFGTSTDLTLYRDAADTLSMRRSTNEQIVCIYNTWTDASNYERTNIRWDTNEFVISTEAAGAGTNRGMVLQSANGIVVTNSNMTANSLSFVDSGELTIATGAITVTGGYHTVDTEADAASDDLDTINGGRVGMVLVLQPEDSTRSVVVKDGTGNIQCAGDFTMDNAQDTITLIYSAALSAWCELARSNNGA